MLAQERKERQVAVEVFRRHATIFPEHLFELAVQMIDCIEVVNAVVAFNAFKGHFLAVRIGCKAVICLRLVTQNH